MLCVHPALLLGNALMFANLARGSALLAHSNYSSADLNDHGSLLISRMDNDGTMAAGVSDPLNHEVLTRLQNDGQRRLDRMQSRTSVQGQRKVSTQQIDDAGWTKHLECPPKQMPDIRNLYRALGVEGFVDSKQGYYSGSGRKSIQSETGIALDKRHWTNVKLVQDKPYTGDKGVQCPVGDRLNQASWSSRPSANVFI